VPAKFHIVTEGEEDLQFLKKYLHFLFGSTASDGDFKNLKGLGNLSGHVPTIQREIRGGAKALLILDANSNRQERREHVEKILGRHSLGPNFPLFLFPDDHSNGAVEDLLEQIIVSEHEGVFACFDGYKKCLNERKRNYTLPGAKGKIYAYKEAIGALRKGADQFDSKYWNYDHPALGPLRDFLTKHIGE